MQKAMELMIDMNPACFLIISKTQKISILGSSNSQCEFNWIFNG